MKPITAFLNTNFPRLRPNVLSSRNHKNFDESTFLNDLNKTITFDNENPNQNYNVLSSRFLEIVNIHALLKKKIITRGNNTPFLDKQLRKAIYT